MTNPWTDWLSSIPVDQQQVLAEALHQRGISHLNGHNKTEHKEIPIICTPASELYATTRAPFVDVFHLYPEYEKFAFHEHGNLLLKGPKGNGKSLSIRAFASHFHIPLVVVECSENTK